MLGDPVRRRILELLAQGELAAGGVVDVVGGEFGISQPAVSQHLRVLRESGFATVRADGSRRLYSVNPDSLDGAEQWIADVRRAWEQRLDALGTELARGARQRRLAGEAGAAKSRRDPAESKSKSKPKRSSDTRRKR